MKKVEGLIKKGFPIFVLASLIAPNASMGSGGNEQIWHNVEPNFKSV